MLTLVGTRKNYSIPFFPGVNIIYGDSDTGKSSVLEFINYLLGSNNLELADEVKSSVEYAALEITINNIDYTIKRNIYNSKDLIEVYQCSLEECAKNFPEKYSPNFSDQNSPGGFYSDFLLDSLNFPKIKIKVSPSQANSDVKRLSFRNLFKYSYLNQDDVGSKGFLDLGNWIKATSNKEVFKYIFNVLDSSISELESEISQRTKESQRLKQKYTAVSEFLRETDYDSAITLDESIEAIDLTIKELQIALNEINNTMIADSSNYLEIKSFFNELSLKEKETTQKILSTRGQIDQYSRLRNDYENDINKINSIKLAQIKIGEISSSNNPCPLCENPIIIENTEAHFKINDDKALNDELDSLIKRQKNIKDLIETLSSSYKKLMKEHSEYESDLNKARELMDSENQEMVTPYLTQRDSLIKEISARTQARVYSVNNLKIRNQQEKIHSHYVNIESTITQLKENLTELQEKAPSIQEVLSKLGDHLNSYLKTVNIKNRTGIKISDKTFAPIIRDRDYFKITSGGLRTITSIGYMLSLLEYSIDNDINHPRLLMIDTVGKYIGKTTKNKYAEETNISADREEGTSDPQKYQNIYECLLATANRAESKDVPCQIILVDNDVPETFVNRFKTYIVAHYSSTGENNLPLGLIDDINI